MNTKTTAMPKNESAANSYWKSVKLCIAKPDGSAEIHHLDGRIVRIAADVRYVGSQRELAKPESVTIAA